MRDIFGFIIGFTASYYMTTPIVIMIVIGSLGTIYGDGVWWFTFIVLGLVLSGAAQIGMGLAGFLKKNS